MSVRVPDAGSVVEDWVDKGLDTLLLCFGGAFVEVSGDEG